MRGQLGGGGHVGHRGQGVPPPVLLNAGDALRVKDEHPPQQGAAVHGQGVGIDLVRRGDHRAGGAEDRGHDQRAGLVRPRPADLQHHIASQH